MVIAIVIVLALFVSDGLLGQFSHLQRIGNTANVESVGVGVYWDAKCSSPVYSIGWGQIEPGSTKNVTVYIRNEGNKESALFLATDSWRPANMSKYMNLTWDYNGEVVRPGNIIQVMLFLSPSSSSEFHRYLMLNDVKEFGFDVIIGVNE